MKISRLLAIIAVLPFAFSVAHAQMPSRPALASAPLAGRFHAPLLAPMNVAALPAPLAKDVPAPSKQGPVRVGFVRELPKAARATVWTPVAGGYVAKFRATSDEALGLRVRLDLGVVPGSMEVRAQGDDGRIETMVLDPTLGPTAWTPWTEGPTQVVELFSPVKPGNDEAVRVGAVVHFDKPLVQSKAAGACTLETVCAATDSSLPAGVADAIAERKKSVMRIAFVSGGTHFVCTATLINTEKFPAPYALTANHCIGTDTEARSITAFFFSESDAACPDQGQPAFQAQVSGGMSLVFTNFNVDSTLLLMNGAPPTGAVYAAYDPTHLATAAPIVSLSHPEGDTMRYAVGSLDEEFRVNDWPQDMYGIRFTHGIIQEGSSGSGLFTLANGSLVLRGILTGTTVTNNDGGLSCTNLTEDGLYSRLEIFGPQIAPYITAAGKPADDAVNRAQDLFSAPADPAQADVLTLHPGTVRALSKSIDYLGDLDVYRIVLGGPAWVSVYTEGGMDTVGTLLDASGNEVAVNDDAQIGNANMGMTKHLGSGTYYLQVAPWNSNDIGAYTVKMRADFQDTNYTDLWWAAPANSESGWGINLNHQGNVIFATLFDYDMDGTPMWLVMSDGERQADGSYQGLLYRTRGPAFNAIPFTPIGPANLTQVGTMRLVFTGPSAATLTYSVNGVQVTKAITRQVFRTAPTCGWSDFDRSFATNFQDLWYAAPAESEAGWGVNITHQGDVLFATLFTYDATGKGVWLVMSDGEKTGDARYSGKLYITHGPAFNAVPFNPAAVSNTEVGTMTFTFTNGNAGTMTYTFNGVSVTKSIVRERFRDIATECAS